MLDVENASHRHIGFYKTGSFGYCWSIPFETLEDAQRWAERKREEHMLRTNNDMTVFVVEEIWVPYENSQILYEAIDWRYEGIPKRWFALGSVI